MRRTPVVVVSAAVLAGCGGTTPPSTDPAASSFMSGVKSQAAQQAALPQCASVLREGSIIKVDANGQFQCKDPDGTVNQLGVQRCNDGTHLGTVEPRSGAPRGWFSAPGPFHVAKGDISTDRGFSAAYKKCNG